MNLYFPNSKHDLSPLENNSFSTRTAGAAMHFVFIQGANNQRNDPSSIHACKVEYRLSDD
jgi:hypothetical protein